MTLARSARRWPVHPVPGRGEALTSWLGRLARVYQLTVPELIRHNLGTAPAVTGEGVAGDLDWDPPPALLEALAGHTGTGVADLRLMTVSGWVPWLADTLDAAAGPEAFGNYVRQRSVLLSQGEAGSNALGRWLPWFPADYPARRPPRRVCPVCAADPDRGTPLTAVMPIMLSCPEHGCRLEAADQVELARALREQPPCSTAPGHVVALDRLTREGMLTGTVLLPGRTVHAGVWFRMLRTLLDEVSISASRAGQRSARALQQVWDTAGFPPRAGLATWRPYEVLSTQRQEAMLEAAACAVSLIEAGTITARGPLGRCLAPEPHREVYEGDRGAWEMRRLAEEVDAWIRRACDDPAIARQVLKEFTAGCRTIASYYAERLFLTRQGIPETYLPSHDELGRDDLRL